MGSALSPAPRAPTALTLPSGLQTELTPQPAEAGLPELTGAFSPGLRAQTPGRGLVGVKSWDTGPGSGHGISAKLCAPFADR